MSAWRSIMHTGNSQLLVKVAILSDQGRPSKLGAVSLDGADAEAMARCMHTDHLVRALGMHFNHALGRRKRDQAAAILVAEAAIDGPDLDLLIGFESEGVMLVKSSQGLGEAG